MIHLTSTLVAGYNELLSYCEATQKLTAKELLNENEGNQILSDIAEEMISYESLIQLLGIESVQPSGLTKQHFRNFVQTYCPEIIEEGMYDTLEQILFS